MAIRRTRSLLLSIASAVLFGLVLLVGFAIPVHAAGSISLTSLGVPVTEIFDTLVNTGTSGTLPNGWYLAESGTNANSTYTAGTGSSTAGDTYSFGSASSTDRAFGGLQSGSLIPTI